MVLTIKFCVESILQESTGSEIHDPGGQVFKIHENVLVFDVPVYDTGLVTPDDGLDHLVEKHTGQFLVQKHFFRDVVVQIFDGFRSLHDDDEGIKTLVIIQQFHHTFHVAHFLQQTDLDRHRPSVQLHKRKKFNKYSEISRYYIFKNSFLKCILPQS